jgi:undecaprenyl-diphosphatase
MVLLDAWAITRARQLPGWLVRLFDEITDYGKSGWLLWPLAILLVGTSVAGARTLSRRTSVLLTAIALRLFFLFCAIGIPGLAVAIVKRIIGRARPFVDGPADPFAYAWPVWRSEYASLPSGHSTTAFAAAFAFGALWPKARPFLWSYAAMIALSRVVVTAHHPSDVVAGAVAGVIGAVLVRDWFAARRLVFAIGGDGVVRALPGPSWRRIKRVARAVVRP